MNTSSISVIIRNRNESEHLRLVLEALSLQDVQPRDIILIDNDSEDDSIKIALSHGAKIATIDKSSFSYGKALNIGIEIAEGDICVILSAHSVPVGPHFLADCLKPFDNPGVAAVRCIYLGKGADQERWMKPELLRWPVDYETVNSRGPLASGCAIRKSVWSQIRFDEDVIAAEEKLWAIAVLKKGYTIYSPSPATYHYIKSIPLISRLLKENRQRMAWYRHEGTERGYIWRTAISGLIESLKAALLTAPAAVVRIILAPIVKTCLKLLLPIQSRKRRRGSLI